MAKLFSTRVLVAVVIAVAVGAAALLVWRLADVFLLGFAGVLVAVLLRACATLVHHFTRLPEGWALALVLVVLAGLLGLGGWLLLPPIILSLGRPKGFWVLCPSWCPSSRRASIPFQSSVL